MVYLPSIKHINMIHTLSKKERKKSSFFSFFWSLCFRTLMRCSVGAVFLSLGRSSHLPLHPLYSVCQHTPDQLNCLQFPQGVAYSEQNVIRFLLTCNELLWKVQGTTEDVKLLHKVNNQGLCTDGQDRQCRQSREDTDSKGFFKTFQINLCSSLICWHSLCKNSFFLFYHLCISTLALMAA